jgi:HEPN domain-containing protein
MKYFQFGIDNDDFNGASFNLHQAAETLFNCVILVFNGYEHRSHDLTELNRLCLASSNQFSNIFFSNDNPKEKRLFYLLQKAYLKSRYDRKYEIDRKQLEYLANRVLMLREIVMSACWQRIGKGLYGGR